MKSIKDSTTEINSKLKRLGLKKEDIEAAVLAGEVSRNNASPLHPKMYPGYSSFAEKIRVLREKLLSRGGWKTHFEKGLEMIIKQDDSFAILVSTGDKATGDKERTPKSKNRKGFATEKLIENNNQLSFLEDKLGRMMAPPKRAPSRVCWYLLVYPGTTEVRYELSLPNMLDGTNKLSGWKERIIFDPIELTAQVATKKVSPMNSDHDQEIVVSVTKKA